MMDFALDNNFDIEMRRGDVVFADDVAQRLKQQFRLWRGEWFTDQRAGFPWRPDILGQKVDQRFLRSEVFRTAADTEGVQSVDSVEVELNGRNARISLSVTVTDGQRQRVEITI